MHHHVCALGDMALCAGERVSCALLHITHMYNTHVHGHNIICGQRPVLTLLQTWNEELATVQGVMPGVSMPVIPTTG